MLETQVQSLGLEDPLEKDMAAHSSTLAWKIQWMEEPRGLQSMELQSWTRLSDLTFNSSLLYGSTHMSIHDYCWNNHSFDHIGLCQ